MTPDYLTALQPSFQRIAGALAYANAGIEAADLVQDMNLHLLENAADPRLSTDARIKTRAAWWAKNKLRAARTYRAYCQPMPVITTEEGEADIAELLPADELTLEESLIEAQQTSLLTAAVRSVIAGLPETQHEIVSLLLTGLTKSQIASQIGVSRRVVSYHVNKIETAFSQVRGRVQEFSQ